MMKFMIRSSNGMFFFYWDRICSITICTTPWCDLLIDNCKVEMIWYAAASITSLVRRHFCSFSISSAFIQSIVTSAHKVKRLSKLHSSFTFSFLYLKNVRINEQLFYFSNRTTQHLTPHFIHGRHQTWWHESEMVHQTIRPHKHSK